MPVVKIFVCFSDEVFGVRSQVEPVKINSFGIVLESTGQLPTGGLVG